MDARRRPGAAVGPVAAVSTFSSTVVDLPEYIVSNFMPSLQPILQRYPFAFRIVGVVLALWYFGPITRLQSLWTRFSSLLVSSINVVSDEDVFDYIVTHLSETRTLRADTSLNAMSNVPREANRRTMMREPEESNRRAAAHNEIPKLKYEETQGTQLFVHNKRLFWAVRKDGSGHVLTQSRYKTAEVLSISCLGRSTAPIKSFLEHIYRVNKDKERALTVIRRPYTGGYSSRLSWSRITAKPRRALDTVILDAAQKEMVIKDVEEYMDESTSAFYGRHGIPYRRGYLLHGPPGTGKTSLSLALANKFNLDVYVLTLLDQNLNDSDLISLLNQLPGRSLLLLEDIDTAGLSNRKAKNTSTTSGPSRRGGRGFPPDAASRRGGAGGGGSIAQKPAPSDEDDDDAGPLTSKVSLSGLLNAIDGVAAPEGHILIMTSNQPHELDDALVRAGRISVRVKFENASTEQAREIFKRMYWDPVDGAAAAPVAASAISASGSVKKAASASTPARAWAKEEIDALAGTFAERLPVGDLSPADLQDYLLMHKKDPGRAVEGMGAWIERTREEKSKKEEEREVERAVRRERKRREEEDWKSVVREAVKETGEEKRVEGGESGKKDAGEGQVGENGEKAGEEARKKADVDTV